MITIPTFEREPDNVFFEGNGKSYNGEVDGIRVTYGFVEPGTYQLTPETDEYLTLHDGEISVNETYLRERGYGGQGYASWVPFKLRAGVQYDITIRTKENLFWSEPITHSDTLAYTCYYPTTLEEVARVEEIQEAHTKAIVAAMAAMATTSDME